MKRGTNWQLCKTLGSFSLASNLKAQPPASHVTYSVSPRLFEQRDYVTSARAFVAAARLTQDSMMCDCRGVHGRCRRSQPAAGIPVQPTS